jgi:TonB family protein
MALVALFAMCLFALGIPSARAQSAAQWLEQGAAAAKAGRLDEAISAYSAVIEISPKSTAARVGRAKAREGKRDVAGALEDYGWALATAPNDAAISEQIDRLTRKGLVAPRSKGTAKTPPPAGAEDTSVVVDAPRRLTYVKPEYPPLALSARFEGVVVIEATIEPDGKVTQAVVLKGHPLLDEAAIAAVRQWVYEPPAQKVPIIMTVTVSFFVKPPTD